MTEMPESEPSSPRRILVVEDEDNIAMALQYVIEREGYRYHRVADGDVAEKAIKDLRPDLILLDIMLPNLSGFEICEAVKRNGDLVGTKVLIMTARGSVKQKERALEVGADGFFTKPFSLDELRAQLRSHLG